MTWREAVVIRILLLVARLTTNEATIRREIDAISNQIQMKARETERIAA